MLRPFDMPHSIASGNFVNQNRSPQMMVLEPSVKYRHLFNWAYPSGLIGASIYPNPKLPPLQRHSISPPGSSPNPGEMITTHFGPMDEQSPHFVGGSPNMEIARMPDFQRNDQNRASPLTLSSHLSTSPLPTVSLDLQSQPMIGEQIGCERTPPSSPESPISENLETSEHYKHWGEEPVDELISMNFHFANDRQRYGNKPRQEDLEPDVDQHGKKIHAVSERRRRDRQKEFTADLNERTSDKALEWAEGDLKSNKAPNKDTILHASVIQIDLSNQIINTLLTNNVSLLNRLKKYEATPELASMQHCLVLVTNSSRRSRRSVPLKPLAKLSDEVDVSTSTVICVTEPDKLAQSDGQVSLPPPSHQTAISHVDVNLPSLTHIYGTTETVLDRKLPAVLLPLRLSPPFAGTNTSKRSFADHQRNMHEPSPEGKEATAMSACYPIRNKRPKRHSGDDGTSAGMSTTIPAPTVGTCPTFKRESGGT